MTMSIEQVGAIAAKDMSPLQFDGQVNQPGIADKASFANLIEHGLGEVNETLNSADAKLKDLALDKPVSTHELMITMEKAKLQLSMAIEVRNKLVEAYQELMRMQL